MMKKIAMALGVLVVLIVGALMVLPLFVSIDKFRPQIQAAVNKKLRGRVEMGELSLSAFPKIKIKIAGLKATAPAPFDRVPLATMTSAEIQMPLTSLLWAPSATFVLVEPKITLSKSGDKSALSEFLPAPEQAAKESGDSGAPQGAGEAISGLPPFVASRIEKARLSFAIEKGYVEMKDSAAQKGDHTVVKTLDLNLTGIGLRTPIDIDTVADCDIGMDDKVLRGPVKIQGQVVYDPQGKINHIKVSLKTDLKDLDLKAGETLHKPAGTTFDLSLDGQVAQGEVTNMDFQKFALNFDKVSTDGSLKLTHAGAPDAGLDFRFEAPSIDLSPFGSFVPVVRNYSLKGNTAIKVLVSGALENLDLNILVKLNNLSGQTPSLKHPIADLDGQIAVTGKSKAPQVNISNLRMKIASSDLGLNAFVAGSAEAPVIKATLSSKNLNLDELMGLKTLRLDEETEAQREAKANDKREQKMQLERARQGGEAMPSLDQNLDKMAPEIEASLKNPLLDRAQATIGMSLNHVRALGADYNAVSLNGAYAKRKLSNATFSLKGYQGTLNVVLNMQLIPEAPVYNMTSKLKGVSIGNFLELHAPSWKGMMTGTTEGDFSLSGQGLRKAQLDKNLGGAFRAQILNGTMKMPVMAMLGKVVNSIPAAGKKLEGKEDPRGTFKTCKIVSSLKGRMIYLDDMDVIYDTEKMNLGDVRFQSKGTVAFDRNVDISGTAYLDPGKLPLPGLRGPSGKDEIPMRFKGDMAEPKPDYEYTAKILGPKIAKGYLETEGGKKLKEEAKKKLGDILNKNVGGGGDGGGDKNEAVKKGLNDLKKKFGF